MDDEEPSICVQCNGSGEGQYDGIRCSYCKGSGVENPQVNDDDYNEPDTDEF